MQHTMLTDRDDLSSDEDGDAGRARGRLEGFVDGYALGCERGSRIGEELGYYAAAAAIIAADLDVALTTAYMVPDRHIAHGSGTNDNDGSSDGSIWQPKAAQLDLSLPKISHLQPPIEIEPQQPRGHITGTSIEAGDTAFSGLARPSTGVSTTASSRARLAAGQVQALVAAYPLTNPADFDVLEALDRVRAKFKLCATLARCPQLARGTFDRAGARGLRLPISADIPDGATPPLLQF